MARKTRRILCDAKKRGKIAGALSIGCSLDGAARLVGCSPSTVRREMQRDEEFAATVAEARSQAEYLYVKRIHSASEKAQYWRAAAWFLERARPEHFGTRSPDAITPAQLAALVAKIAEIIHAEVPVARYRKRLLKRLDALTADFRHASDEEPGSIPAEEVSDGEE